MARKPSAVCGEWASRAAERLEAYVALDGGPARAVELLKSLDGAPSLFEALILFQRAAFRYPALRGTLDDMPAACLEL